MPKIVDKDARREELAQAVWRVITKKGMSAVTIRSVADEASWSYGILAHYFPDKESLVSFASELAVQRFHEAVAARAHGLHGIEALRAMLEVSLPIDQERRVAGLIWLNFVARAMENKTLRGREVRDYSRWRRQFVDVIRGMAEAGELRADVDAEFEADLLIMSADGLAHDGLVDRRRYGRARLHRMLDAQLQAFMRRNAPEEPLSP